MVMPEPPPRRSPSHEGDSEARDIIHPVMANITTTHHYGYQTVNATLLEKLWVLATEKRPLNFMVGINPKRLQSFQSNCEIVT